MSNYSSSNTTTNMDTSNPSTLTAAGNTTTGPNVVPTGTSMTGSGIDTNNYDSTTGFLHNKNSSNTFESNRSSGLGSGSGIGSSSGLGTSSGLHSNSGTGIGSNSSLYSSSGTGLGSNSGLHSTSGTGIGSNTAYGSGSAVGSSGMNSGIGQSSYNTGSTTGLGQSHLGSTTSAGAPYSSSQSGLNTSTGGLGSTNYNDGFVHDNTTSSHLGRSTAAPLAAGAAGGALGEHERHTHGHHHDHTGHHPHSGLQRAGIGRDPALLDNNPSVAGTNMQGTGLASGFAVNPTTIAAVNPATGAPDYNAVQTANVNDNVYGSRMPVGATTGLGAGALGAATAASASKVATASGLPKRVLMVLTSSTMTMPDGKNSGYHWSEVFHPYEIFKKHGYDVDLTSLTGKASPDYHSVNWLEQLTGLELSSMNAWRSKSHPLHKDLENIRTPNQLQGSQYGIIYFTGGHATLEDFPNAEAYQRLASEIYENNGIVCAVCHGVCCLGNARLRNGSYLLNGKQVTGFSEEGEKQMKVLDWMHERKMPLIQDYVSRSGGIYQAPNKPFDEFVVDSDRVITGPNPASAGPVAERAVRILEGR